MRPAADATLTTRPEPRGTIRRAACRVPWITPATFTASWRRTDSAVSSSTPTTGMIPALFTITSRVPSRSSTSSRKAPTLWSSVTSTPAAIAPISAAVRCASSASMSPMATRAPAATKARAVAAPIPRAAPVMATTCPVSVDGLGTLPPDRHLMTSPYPPGPA
ncbi:hypothetical protein OHX15_20570 [Mycolicibacterium parafortuitum]|uniref:Uncharacterized protein n=1 Tax=Mycolicibacterium parafortuitum TaxID=39692 RepID=A0ACC6MLM7_MYCPF|nr:MULTISPECIES: hypothetical protein [Mycobacteriaceae]MDZ5087792.1 hypothetical protein [Mycolicibacterium parafortuitum]